MILKSAILAQKIKPRVFLTASWVSIILFAFLISPWDCQISFWMTHHNIPWFSSFFANSLFEGEPIGAGDIATLLMIASAVLYLVSWLPSALPLIGRWRPELGFLLLSSVIATICVVHGFKYIIGRARPDLVIHQGAVFTYWFEPGPFNPLTYTVGGGSFPSGHTAAMTILIAFAYIITFSAQPQVETACGRYIIGLSVAFCLLMTIARSMNGSHFITDGLVVTGTNWLIIHSLFFYALDVPAQKKGQTWPDNVNRPPFMWELRLSLYALAATALFTVFSIGCRYMASSGTFSSGMLCVIGLIGALFFIYKFYLLLKAGRQLLIHL